MNKILKKKKHMEGDKKTQKNKKNKNTTKNRKYVKKTHTHTRKAKKMLRK